MTETGKLVEWNDDRGFGFVQAAAGARLFVHISAFERALRRPEPGDRLVFSRGLGRDGRPSVAIAQIVGATRQRVQAQPGPTVERVESAQTARALRLLVVTLLLGAAIILPVPRFVLVAYVVMGAASFFAYAFDKQAAEEHRWRTPEATLHSVDILGGIIGGLLAQAALHHKTAKPGFSAMTFGIAFAHLAVLGVVAFNDPGLLALLN